MLTPSDVNLLSPELQELYELEQKATPGPWKPLLNAKGMTGVHAADCTIYHANFDPVCLKETWDRQMADASLIAALRNAFDDLLSELVEGKKREQEIGTATAEMTTCLQNWLGHATTREAAMESLWRVCRLLERRGFRAGPQNELEWRGVIIKAMEDAGIGLGEDEKVRLRKPDHKPWEHASGELLTDVIARAEAAESSLAEMGRRLEEAREVLQTIADFAVGNGDVCEIIARRARAALSGEVKQNG